MTEPIRLANHYERPGLPALDLPAALTEAYGGGIGFDPDRVYSNFVSTLDGVVALRPDVSPSAISGKSSADRMVMGLLRACADAVVVGSGTIAAEPRHRWTPAFIYPDLADAFAELRERRGVEAVPRLVVLTRSGDVPEDAPAFAATPALVLTTEAGAARLRGRLPSGAAIHALADDLRAVDVIAYLRGEGHRTILTEGGPTIIGAFLRDRSLDEAFLTLSPRVAGRDGAAARPGLVEGFALPPDDLVAAELLSLKRYESHLFLRYALR